METKKPAQKQAQKPAQKEAKGKLAAIRIRNITKADGKMRGTLDMLGLRKSHTCVIVPNTEAMRGMINKVKDYVTYGEIEEETAKMLEQKRGKKGKDGARKDFHLSPPRGGFERKGIKHNYEQGGALGYRGKKINELIKKML
jgi:large subunit ribosomal protein L30